MSYEPAFWIEQDRRQQMHTHHSKEKEGITPGQCKLSYALLIDLIDVKKKIVTSFEYAMENIPPCKRVELENDSPNEDGGFPLPEKNIHYDIV